MKSILKKIELFWQLFHSSGFKWLKGISVYCVSAALTDLTFFRDSYFDAGGRGSSVRGNQRHQEEEVNQTGLHPVPKTWIIRSKMESGYSDRIMCSALRTAIKSKLKYAQSQIIQLNFQ